MYLITADASSAESFSIIVSMPLGAPSDQCDSAGEKHECV